MADSYTTNRNYRLQTTGGNINTWGIYLNTVLTQIDANLGAVLALNVGGNTNITLTSTQAQNLIHDLTGVLTGNIDYTFPNQGGFWFIRNSTTGSFTLTTKVSGGANGIVIPQGGIGFPVFIDTTVPAIYPVYTNNTFVGGTSAGTATVQTLTTANTNFTLKRGNIVSFISGFNSGVGMTLAVDGTAATTVQLGGSAIVAGNFSTGSALLAYYDGTNFQLIGGSAVNLSLYATLASPTFTGTPSLPTGTTGVTQAITDSSTKLATTAFAKTVMTKQTFTSGSGTYNTPSGALFLKVRMLGGGGGGAGSGSAPSAATDGGDTTFGTLTAAKGIKGVVGSAGGAGGAGTNGDLNLTGGSGEGATSTVVSVAGGDGGVSALGGNGRSGAATNGTASAGTAAIANSGSGGGGASSSSSNGNSGSGGGAGAYVEKLITAPSATYSYAVGANGAGGGAGGSGGAAGGNGGSGLIIVEEYYIG